MAASYELPIGPIQTEEKTEPTTIDVEAPCNCYRWTEIYSGRDLPPMVNIKPSSITPSVGAIAIMWYGNVKHVAVVTAINGEKITIKEGNYHRCRETERVITTNYPHLTGFYN